MMPHCSDDSCLALVLQVSSVFPLLPVKPCCDYVICEKGRLPLGLQSKTSSTARMPLDIRWAFPAHPYPCILIALGANFVASNLPYSHTQALQGLTVKHSRSILALHKFKILHSC